ncbi:sn1-specific diacylglycerol lipase alpha-like isoform X2 [Anneissia japonica]|uniref:sn1-specific diacylglycerol lipase alpha-like isoform X2 n=1 Tax=Anneissia japonica TaxID=1529436 RepID=UPI001425B4B3|nr:sn1-specific diacylglycerol lipase alpha-like isoform X2 [Anneissia japonica]
MPGMLVFGRRWSVGSDDIVVPALILLVSHLTWFIVLCVLTVKADVSSCSSSTSFGLKDFTIIFLVLLSLCLAMEFIECVVALQGTIMNTKPRSSMQYLLYIRFVLFITQIGFIILGSICYHKSNDCERKIIGNAVLGIVIFNGIVVLLVLVTIWCVYDRAGRSFVQLQKREKQTMRHRTSSRVQKQELRLRKTQELYERNWHNRCRLLCCCAGVRDTQENAFAEVAELFSEFFRDLDIVPSDVFAGLLLLREEQKRKRNVIIANPRWHVMKFLSGIPITPQTRFLDLENVEEKQLFNDAKYYMKYASAAYGWPVYALLNPTTGFCQLCQGCRCCCCLPCLKKKRPVPLDDDNCCHCNYAALKKISGLDDSNIVYTTFHSAVSRIQPITHHAGSVGELSMDMEGLRLVGSVSNGGQQNAGGEQNSETSQTVEQAADFPPVMCLETSMSFQEVMDERCMDVEPETKEACCLFCIKTSNTDTVLETPFFVAIDHEMRTVVIAIRGTLSMQDCLTDCHASSTAIPVEGCSENFQAHKGMVEAALYIKKKLTEELLLTNAFMRDTVHGSAQQYKLVLVGHSLGAGTATVLAILLRPDYPELKCFAFSPPGGLLNKEALEYSKEFVLSVVVGKDVVIRIGLPQLEVLRSDLLNCMTRCKDPKWKVIMSSLMCCLSINHRNLSDETENGPISPCSASLGLNPQGSAFPFSGRTPLFPPGKILHLVRNNPKREGISRKNLSYYGVWRDNCDFDEVLVSPVMINDHLPSEVMSAFDKCLDCAKVRSFPKEFFLHHQRQKQDNSSSSQLTASVPQLQPVPKHASRTYLEHNANYVTELTRNSSQNISMSTTSESSTLVNEPISTPVKSPLLNGFYDPLKMAPLASTETIDSVSETSSIATSMVAVRLRNPPRRETDEDFKRGSWYKEGYCYYVSDAESQTCSTPSNATPLLQHRMQTQAIIEGSLMENNNNSMRAGPSHVRNGTPYYDRFCYSKRRTSNLQCYTLTYDDDMSSDDKRSRPKSLPIAMFEDSYIHPSSPSSPEPKVGFAYTKYFSVNGNYDPLANTFSPLPSMSSDQQSSIDMSSEETTPVVERYFDASPKKSLHQEDVLEVIQKESIC